jgi:hypothetical protein
MKKRGTKKKLHFKKRTIIELNDSQLNAIKGGLIMHNNPVLNTGGGDGPINTSLFRPLTNHDRPTTTGLCRLTSG